MPDESRYAEATRDVERMVDKGPAVAQHPSAAQVPTRYSRPSSADRRCRWRGGHHVADASLDDRGLTIDGPFDRRPGRPECPHWERRESQRATGHEV
jgi:hypothetical protein